MSQYVLNNVKLIYGYKLKDFFLKKMYGLKLKTLNIFEKRLELFSWLMITDLDTAQHIAFLNVFYRIVPQGQCLRNRRLSNIFFLNVINSYRGWRHSRGLPVRGQRTWSNAWSCYRSNLVLREFRIIVAKRIYGNIPLDRLNVADLAEQINLLWKLQWAQEWRQAKKKRLMYLRKNINVYKVDLYSMSRGIVAGYTKKKDRDKKQKRIQSMQKNAFSLGFDEGFTKNLLKTLQNPKSKTGPQSKITVVTDANSTKLKKKPLKKKSAVPTTAKKKKK